MQDAFLPAIQAIKTKIAAKEAEIAPLRQELATQEAEISPLTPTANELCKLAGLPPEYSLDVPNGTLTPQTNSSAPRFSIRPDQFFNKDLSEAAVEYLTARKTVNGDTPSPATVDEIYAALVSGGYKFNGTSDASNKTALKTALTRNTAQMAKISDDLYGLRKWYGMRASRRGATTEGGDTGTTTTTTTDAETTPPATTQ
jgi:hypothetical protein